MTEINKPVNDRPSKLTIDDKERVHELAVIISRSVNTVIHSLHCSGGDYADELEELKDAGKAIAELQFKHLRF